MPNTIKNINSKVIDLDTNFITSTNALIKKEYMNKRMDKHVDFLKQNKD